MAEYLKSQFHKNAEPLPQIDPTEMKIPSTDSEIERATKNKSLGNDEVVVEFIYLFYLFIK